jgi:DNA-binding HxlR family transcriptional regulator
MQSGAASDESVTATVERIAPETSFESRGRDPELSTQEVLQSMSRLVGRKWHPVILYQLQTVDQAGFNELKEQLGEISSKVLSDTLSELMTWDTVQRRIVQERPVRVAYSLTPAGRQLGPLLEAMDEWGRTHAVAHASDE